MAARWGWEEGEGRYKSDTGPRQAEPPGSNPILARYTLSPVNHNSVLGAAAALPLPPEPGMKPLRRTSARAQAPLSSSRSRWSLSVRR